MESDSSPIGVDMENLDNEIEEESHISPCKKRVKSTTSDGWILKSQQIDQRVVREMGVALIIELGLPFNFFELKGIRRWVNYLNPDAILISRNMIVADVLNIYKKEKEKLKQIMASIPTRICLTFDFWTSCPNPGYICLTAHFVDTNWKLNSKILNFCIPPLDPDFELSQMLLDILKDWEIEKKILSITLDDSSPEDNMPETLKNQLASENWLLCDGEFFPITFFHVHCFAHILDLIVREGLEVAGDVVHKIRESVHYLRNSESRLTKFKECIEQIDGVDTSTIGLRIDIPTRWNTTYLMLKSALKYQNVFASLQLIDKSYEYCPSLVEWKRGEKICELLLPFYYITNLICGTSYPTSNWYFLLVWKIQCVLNDTLSDEDEVIKSMAERMVVKFEKYWDEYSVVLALGAVLDPRMKLSSLAYCFSKVNSAASDQTLEHIRRKLYMLFEKYSGNNSSNSNVQSAVPTQSSSIQKKFKEISEGIFQEFKMHHQQLATKSGRSQLDVYLDEPNLNFDYHENLDVLQWWKDNNYRFPDLSLMARDLLSIPIIRVGSESTFSIGARVFNKYKCRRMTKNIQASICARNWLHGFVNLDDDDEEDEILSVEYLSKEASNILDEEED
ncbi:zinc finger BED domain-containing protein RICESLEEPER 2-like [Gastrolobium bilobum]|uniref:zinc finger BED domain-containing protein RICESLEEPER 2-like n=1 Tax=Gastrolobium bilobum TaxID=150636 RepID=UPI002AAF758C|nr:zinc finger BED domain-containing protein RICESLEEPER 2-like [Gastrolobium bilobum]